MKAPEIKETWEAQWSTRESPLREKGWHIFVPDTVKELVAEIPDHLGDNLEGYALTKARAHLIAAAPDLLDALENLWKSCILADQTAIGRIHLEHAAHIISKAKGAK